MTIWPKSGCHGQGQKIFDQDHGQNFKFFVVKMVNLKIDYKIESKMPILAIDHGANSRVSVAMVMFLRLTMG